MKRLTFQVVLLLTTFPLYSTLPAHAEDVRHDAVKVSGEVIDSQTGNPIAGARLDFLGERLSPVLSRTDGHIEFYLPSKVSYRIEITCAKYRPETREIPAEKDAPLRIKLDPLVEEGLSITKTAFQRGVFIKGKVTGLQPGLHENLKVVVYMYTDKWYIHPYKSNDPGKGYAEIKPDGSWRISTKSWGHQAFMAAYLIVDKSWIPTSPIAVPDDVGPEAALLLKVPAKAHQVESPAPKGM